MRKARFQYSEPTPSPGMPIVTPKNALRVPYKTPANHHCNAGAYNYLKLSSSKLKNQLKMPVELLMLHESTIKKFNRLILFFGDLKYISIVKFLTVNLKLGHLL